MSEKFIFHGQTTFIDKPKDVVIENFQNTYIAGNNSESDRVNLEIKTLINLVLDSKNLPPAEKEETIQALHSVAEQVKEQKGSKLTIKGTLKAIQEIVAKAVDIAVPALEIITTVFRLLRLS